MLFHSEKVILAKAKNDLHNVLNKLTNSIVDDKKDNHQIFSISNNWLICVFNNGIKCGMETFGFFGLISYQTKCLLGFRLIRKDTTLDIEKMRWPFF